MIAQVSAASLVKRMKRPVKIDSETIGLRLLSPVNRADLIRLRSKVHKSYKAAKNKRMCVASLGLTFWKAAAGDLHYGVVETGAGVSFIIEIKDYEWVEIL